MWCRPIILSSRRNNAPTSFIFLCVPAFAEENGEKDEKVDVSDTVSGVTGRAPSLKIDDVNRIHGAALYDGAKSREYPDRIYDGAKWLGSTPEFVWTCWEVMNALYKRDNKGIHAILDKARQNFLTLDCTNWKGPLVADFDA